MSSISDSSKGNYSWHSVTKAIRSDSSDAEKSDLRLNKLKSLDLYIIEVLSCYAIKQLLFNIATILCLFIVTKH